MLETPQVSAETLETVHLWDIKFKLSKKDRALTKEMEGFDFQRVKEQGIPEVVKHSLFFKYPNLKTSRLSAKQQLFAQLDLKDLKFSSQGEVKSDEAIDRYSLTFPRLKEFNNSISDSVKWFFLHGE